MQILFQIITLKLISEKLAYHATCSIYYRPHPKDGGSYCFQFVCQSTPRWGVYPSQVWMVGGVARLGLDGGGVVTLARSGWWGGGTPARSGWCGVPQLRLDGGEVPGQVWMMGVPPPGLDGGGTTGTLQARSGWWGVPRYPPTITRWDSPPP